ncbi:MAG TPA: hypothetical protein VHR18_00330 [Solirubrobacterales bacterium]|nr:hypothetical protein [Solirubrobacterales bacterium]
MAVLAGCEANRRETDSPVIEVRPDRGPDKERPRPRPQTVAPSHCSADVPECAVTEGEIFYIEAVDPDGDGDAHFVIFDSQSITLPGVTAIDVEKGLRPHPLPKPGTLVSAAGPVQTGSYGQSQIHALELHVAGE